MKKSLAAFALCFVLTLASLSSAGTMQDPGYVPTPTPTPEGAVYQTEPVAPAESGVFAVVLEAVASNVGLVLSVL